MRGNRRNSSTPLSLFSFQDIITSVMGILLFVVLMMSLQTKMVADAVGQSSPESTATPPAIQAMGLKQQIADAEAEIEELRAIADLSKDQARDRIVARTKQLRSLYAEISEVEDRRASLIKEASEGTEDNRVLAAVLSSEQQVLKLRKELDETTMSRRLTYIARQDFDRQALIVQLDKSGMRFAPSPAADDTTYLPGSESVRFKQLKALLAPYPRDKYYVLFVMKPSAMTDATRKLKDDVAKLGYQWGEDLIPEDWTTVFGDAK